MRHSRWLLIVSITTMLVLLNSWRAEADEAPLPTNLKIVSPDSSIAEDVAAFSGRWVGIWEGKLSSALVVQKIYPADSKGRYKAEVLYTWGTYSAWYITNSGMRELDGEIKDGQLVARNGPVVIRYRLSNDRNALEGQYQNARGQIFPGTFKKAGN